MLTITATIPIQEPPTWAILQRQLIDLMNQATQPFLDRYVNDDDELIWREGGTGSRDGADDFYEATFNWPLFYLLGGDDHLLEYGQRIWDGITRQLTRAGMLHKEYEQGYDHFHQGESYIYFYFLCLADPTNLTNLDRAERFAGFYLNEDPDLQEHACNYDPIHKIIRAPHNGSRGPRWGFSNAEPPSYNWGAGMRVYGLPFHDIEGIDHYDDLNDPAKARAMGQAMHERMGQGDVVGNLIVTSLVTNAYLMTGDTKYRDWIIEYVDGWVERAKINGELLPDNVGPNGLIGETMNGKWYGGLYGWTWPHGYYNIGMAATVAGINAGLVSGDWTYLALPRTQFDFIWQLGEVRDVRNLEMSLSQHWINTLGDADDDVGDTDLHDNADNHTGDNADDIRSFHQFVVPYRYSDKGWFDYQPLSPVYPTAIWNVSQADEDWARIKSLQQADTYDWRTVNTFRNKEDGGHDQPWLCYLAGENPNYPEEMLRAALGNVYRRLALIADDDADLAQVSIHHWQEHNPVVTEALLQLTLGAPQIIYNGGLLHCRVRYFDADRQRPGLPEDVAALLKTLEADRTVLQLVNLSPLKTRRVIVQAGGFGEHRFGTAAYSTLGSEYPGSHKAYAAPPIESEMQSVSVDSHLLQVDLPPATQIVLDLETERYVNQPSYGQPW
ncbi:MAG: hypothetical protein AAF702_35825 [Chloroflexota bacterium]